ncbi:type IX secretion system sortase PorU [Halosquirtibacter laminarini]|uniref:Type IX secretion system sortase PorU n=1 Tax=Halosquirtibacter laminarini TaxID=3374600 RepID=A0AC61NFM4_9BACT|nr:type IX secretion system sortase PorU [Prolixibacteraceae bacterium]
MMKLKVKSLNDHNLTLNTLSIWTTRNTEIDNSERFDFRDLTEISYYVGTDIDGDKAVFFYLHPTNDWRYNPYSKNWECNSNLYSRRSYVYITDKPASVQFSSVQRNKKEGAVTLKTYEKLHASFFRKESILHSGRKWYSEGLLGSKRYHIPKVWDRNTLSSKITISGIGRSSYYSKAQLLVDGNISKTVNLNKVFDAHEGVAAYPFIFRNINASENTSLDVFLQGNDDVKYHMSFIQYVLTNSLRFEDNTLYFQNSQTVEGSNTSYNFEMSNISSSMKVWDITDPLHYQDIVGTKVGSILSFEDIHKDTVSKYVAFDPRKITHTPDLEKEIGSITNSFQSSPEYIIIYHEKFKEQAEAFKRIHSDNMIVETVNVDDVFTYYGGNIKDPGAIRNYLKRRYDKQRGTSHPLEYVLFLGRGTYDPITPTSNKNPNYVPSNQSLNSLDGSKTFVSDDVFGLMDEGENELFGTVDLAVGRIPCITTEQADAVLNKIRGYISPDNNGNWSMRSCVIADDGDNGIHLKDAERISSYISTGNPSMLINKIYFDSYPKDPALIRSYPDVTNSIKEFMKEGGLIMNYTGHANTMALAHERVIEKQDIHLWNNGYHLPLFITATCDFSHWDMKEDISAGEEILFHKNGGGIGLFSTTRLVYSSSNYQLNKNIYKELFVKDSQGNPPTLGIAMKRAKRETSGVINKRKFSLIGDPAIKLKMPKLRVSTDIVDGEPIGDSDVKVKLLSPVAVEGSINNSNGDVYKGSGNLVVKVLDKAIDVQTLGNSGNNVEGYSEQKNVLFQSNVSVENGKFDFVFVLPKDISYKDGNYRISYYFKGDKIDGVGDFVKIKSGGVSSSVDNDNKGPSIHLEVDSKTWENNISIGEEPTWKFYLEDTNGINTSLSSIGHQMVLILDHDNSKRFVLNDYFQFDSDSYTSGVVEWKPLGLSKGKHHFKVKFWDLLNNSNVLEGSFNVEPSLEVNVSLIYPNPTKGIINATISHNMAYSTVYSEVFLHDFSGRIIARKSLDFINTESNINIDLRELGAYVSGVYILRFVSKNKDGEHTQTSKKIILEL